MFYNIWPSIGIELNGLFFRAVVPFLSFSLHLLLILNDSILYLYFLLLSLEVLVFFVSHLLVVSSSDHLISLLLFLPKRSPACSTPAGFYCFFRDWFGNILEYRWCYTSYRFEYIVNNQTVSFVFLHKFTHLRMVKSFEFIRFHINKFDNSFQQ